MFIDGYECENIVEYRKTFFKKMKILLAYLLKFFEDDSILKKVL